MPRAQFRSQGYVRLGCKLPHLVLVSNHKVTEMVDSPAVSTNVWILKNSTVLGTYEKGAENPD